MYPIGGERSLTRERGKRQEQEQEKQKKEREREREKEREEERDRGRGESTGERGKNSIVSSSVFVQNVSKGTRKTPHVERLEACGKSTGSCSPAPQDADEERREK